MSLWNTVKKHAKAQFLDVIQWMEDDRQTIVWRFPIFNQAIQDGGKLVVREGQAAIFVNEGKLSQVFGPGTYELSTRTEAIWSFFESIKYRFNYPYKGDIFFVSTRRFTDQKWGTPKPVMFNDKQLGPVRLRAFGIYSYKVKDPATFLREIVGNDGLFTTSEIDGQLKRKLVSAFAQTVGESGIPILELAAQYMNLGEALRDKMSPWFEQSYGIQLTDFVVESVSLPPEVEKFLDKRTSMGLVGDMGAFTQFQTANAIDKMAGRPGAANPLLDAGMGLAMGGQIGRQMASAPHGAFDPKMGAAPPPPPPPAGRRFHYAGPSGQAQLSAAEIADKVAADRGASHNVWAPGWPAWKPWNQVPEIASLVPPEMPAAGAVYHYAGPSGQAELSVADIVARVRKAPGARHLVWKAGFDGWKPAAQVPEIAQALQALAPPPPPAGAVPPPPPPAGATPPPPADE